MAHYKDLTYLVVDVGAQAHQCIAAWVDGVLSAIARRIMLGKNQELALILFGSNNTLNKLSEKPEYEGIEVVFSLQACSVDMWSKVQARLVPSTGPADFISALIVALDDMTRQRQARKLNTSRKTVWIVSPLLDPTEPLDSDQIKSLASKCVDDEMRVSINVAVAQGPTSERPDPASAPALHPVAAANVQVLEALHAAGVAGRVVQLEQPSDFRGLVQAQPTFTSLSTTLKMHDFEFEMKAYSIAMKNKLPAAQLYSQVSQTADATHVVKRDTAWYLAGKDGADVEPVPPENRVKMYRFSKEGFPAAEDSAYKWKELLSATNPLKEFKGIQVLTFIDAEAPADDDAPVPMPRWAYQGCGHFLIPATQKAATATAALVLAMLQAKKHALVRYVLRANSAISLGVLVPVEGPTSDTIHAQRSLPSHFILHKASYKGDFRRIPMKSLPDVLDLIPLDEGVHVDPMEALTTSMTGPWASPHFLSDIEADPMVCRFDMAVVEAGIAALRTAAGNASSSSGAPWQPAASASALKDAIKVKPLEADPLAQRLLFPDRQQALAAKQTVSAAFGTFEVAAEATTQPEEVAELSKSQT